MAKKPIKPVHPGLYLKELLDELNISQYRLAKDLGIPAMRINMDITEDALADKVAREVHPLSIAV